MIDFVRIQYQGNGKSHEFIENVVDFDKITSRVDLRTGTLDTTTKTMLKSLDITIGENVINVKNSLHKMFNLSNEGVKHNYNDFTYSNLVDTIEFMKSKLKGIEKGYITQMEFGLNIPVTKPAQNILRENVLMHNYECFNSNNQYKGRGEYREFVHENYSIKIYDKAKQFKRPDNILRVEIKFTRRKEFNRLGIWNLDDLKSKEKLLVLFKYLLKRLDELTILDSFNEVTIPSNQDRIDLIQYSSYLFWQKLQGVSKKYFKAKHKKRFNELIRKYNLDRTKRQIRLQLIQKMRELLAN